MSSSTPHDALFRAIFSSPENAAGQLRAVLPRQVADGVDWSTLCLQPGSYLEPDLTAISSDLLYSVKLGDSDALLYLLYEHQSTEQAMMPLRLLRYMVAIWEQWLRGNEGASTLPVIVPVVLSNAEGVWRKPVSMDELYAMPVEMLEGLRDHVPRFRFVLDDLTRRTDDELLARTAQALGILGTLVLRHGRDEQELAARLAEWGELLVSVWNAEDGRDAMGKVVRYALLANRRTTIQDLAGVLEPMLGQGAREVVMTEGERLIQQGEVRGMAKGRAEGRAEGRAASVIAVLSARAMRVSDQQREHIEKCADIVTLDRWIVRAATVESVDEVFADE